MNDIKVNGDWINLPKIMKYLNFVEEPGYFIKGFTVIYVEDNSLYIGHDINNKKTKIEYCDLKQWISYFDKL